MRRSSCLFSQWLTPSPLPNMRFANSSAGAFSPPLSKKPEVNVGEWINHARFWSRHNNNELVKCLVGSLHCPWELWHINMVRNCCLFGALTMWGPIQLKSKAFLSFFTRLEHDSWKFMGGEKYFSQLWNLEIFNVSHFTLELSSRFLYSLSLSWVGPEGWVSMVLPGLVSSQS